MHMNYSPSRFKTHMLHLHAFLRLGFIICQETQLFLAKPLSGSDDKTVEPFLRVSES